MRSIEHGLLLAVRWPALVLLVLLLATGLGGFLVRSRSTLALPAIDGEEPRLGPPRLTLPPSSVAVVTLAGLEPGCGVSTLTFNLAVSLAILGEKPATERDGRLPVRPACLLAEGALSAALSLDSRALEERLHERRWDVRPEVATLGVRHASGCTLFCLKGGRPMDDGVRRLIGQLKRHHDAVLVDGAVIRPERLSVLDPTDLLLLVALSTDDSVETAGRWITDVWTSKREASTALVVNRVRAWPPPAGELLLAFHHLVLLPDEPRVAALDRRGLPWSLDDRLAITPQARRLLPLLFPTLTCGGSRRAA